ncbi:MAG: hypothetical protein HKN87_10465 [Saprospiraceae bacterium]|nr:hypothetical protein [Saprospiraceae bacterium]
MSQGSQSEKEEMEMVVTTDSGLQYQIMKEGVGKGAQVGEEVLIFETTMYRDDTVLYSNEDTDQPIKVKLGAGQVLAGIEEGLQGMREGEVRKMMIPAELARRKFYPDHISPDSALVVKMILFDILK